MKHETYVFFVKKMNIIYEDCRVDIDVAETDSERYTIYQMKTPAICRMKVAYDKKKLKKHIKMLREICENVPQIKRAQSVYVIPVGQLNDANLKQVADSQKRRQKAHQCASLAELFLSMCVTCEIMDGISQDPDTPSTIYGVMKERIRSFYQED